MAGVGGSRFIIRHLDYGGTLIAHTLIAHKLAPLNCQARGVG
jgi:hypothetical protein